MITMTPSGLPVLTPNHVFYIISPELLEELGHNAPIEPGRIIRIRMRQSATHK